MELHFLNDYISVSGQISPEDVTAIAASGFNTIICHCPDFESGPDQPTYAAIAEAAKEFRIITFHQPVVAAALSDEDINDFAAHMNIAEAPVLAYCRSGTRSAYLWAINELNRGTDPKTVFATTSEAGYNFPDMP